MCYNVFIANASSGKTYCVESSYEDEVYITDLYETIGKDTEVAG